MSLDSVEDVTKIDRQSSAVTEEHRMSTPHMSSSNPGWAEQAFLDGAPMLQPRLAHVPSRSARRDHHRNADASMGHKPKLRRAHAELLADIDGIPVLVRFLLADTPGELPSDFTSGGDDLHALLLTKVQKAAERLGGSRLRGDDRAKRPLAIVELIASIEHVARLSATPAHTVLRVGPLELDLLDRTATRDGRRIDLRPREFQLLKYMMERSDVLLTRAILMMEVWRYKFVPESNLVDVHMSKLRRKVDGPNELPLIRNVRGAGFILSPPPASMPASAERMSNVTSGKTTGALDRFLRR